MQGLLPLIVMFGLMWALLIRPQQRRVRLQRALVDSLQPGDEVITSGGLCGTILSVDQEILVLEVAPGVSVRLLRVAVQQRIGPDDENDGDTGSNDTGSDDTGSDEAHLVDDEVLDTPPTTKPDGTV